MKERTYEFDYPANETSIIKVIGVGGGGSNAVNHMFRQGIRGVEFYVANTDIQALQMSPVPNKIQIGLNSTKGLGAGANPERGKTAAMESKDEIRNILANNTKMVFITAGMGGGTGTGAAPVIAQIAKEMGILTVGIVTFPFMFEGKPKYKRAEEGLAELRANCDAVIVILNNRLKEIYGNTSVKEAFNQADEVLTKGAKSIAEIITVSGLVNVDFEDVKTVLKDSGAAVMGSATVDGENRARRAVEMAINSPLLNDTDIFGARHILVSITVSDLDNFKMSELEEINEYVQEKAGEEAEIILGQAIDETLGESITVTIIATGFESKRNIEQKRVVYDLPSNKILTPKIKLELEDSMDFFDKGDEEIKPVKKETVAPAKKPEKVVFQLETDDYKSLKGYEDAKKKDEVDVSIQIHQKQLNNLRSFSELSNEEFNEKKEIPAYLRKKVELKEVPHSSENHLSRLKIGEDNGLLGGNRFLHDNVD
jgi:cell division protein FtsZ